MDHRNFFAGFRALAASAWVVALVAPFVVGTAGHAVEIAAVGGTYGNWPVSWTAVPGLNDPIDNALADIVDIVGDTTDPAFYWARDSQYLYTRMRVYTNDDPTVTLSDFTDTHLVLIDIGDGDVTPDYGFAWDSNIDSSNHELEMMVFGSGTTPWGSIRMDDLDGNNGQKLPVDINGAARTPQDGYVRLVTAQNTANFGNNTTLIDFAVSLNYLSTITALYNAPTWNLQLATIRNANDHGQFADIAGNLTLDSAVNSSSYTSIINPVPEPGMALLALTALGLLVAWRKPRRHAA